MRPLKLQLRGFTAFREPTEIDFTSFDVFAVSGPTGSGKSSLLDAMTYALYGRVERVGDRVGQLVSQGQPRMAVSLEFEVGHHRYRVTRSTPASKGSTKILLERLIDGEWKQAGEGADRVREAEPMIARAIGLTYDGFTRSILLPQGRFAEFLVGDPKKRRDILTELLGLSLFRRMAERAGAIGKEASVRAETMTGLLERDYAGATPEALKDAKAAARTAEKRERELGLAAEVVLESLGQLQESKRSAEELQACAQEAGRAAEQAAGAAHELEELAARMREADEHMVEAASHVASAQEGLDGVRRELEDADKGLGSIERLTEAQLTARRLAEASTLRAGRDADRGELAAAAERLAASIHDVEAEVASGRQEAKLREADAATAEAALEDARHADLVAAVSAGLKAGDPCPVCGVRLEKAPKRTATGAVKKAEAAAAASREHLAAARARLTDAEDSLDAARREMEANAGAQSRLVVEMEELDGTIDEAMAHLRAVLGDPIPDDPSAEVERRMHERQTLDRSEREAIREVTEAERSLMKVQHDRERVVGLVERLGDRLAFDHGSLFERASRASGGAVTPPSVHPAPDSQDTEGLRQHAEQLAETLAAFAAALTKEVADRSSLEDRLLTDALGKVGELVEPVRSLEDLAASISAAYRTATSQLATAAKSAEDLAARMDRKKELDREVQELVVRSRLFKALSLELRADRLIAFLQAEALQVLAAAGSERLAGLSEGRYRLMCHGDEFVVVDTWNGDEERSVRTLSGGETFLASLALALALADQVRSLSVRDRATLDSLFLDEGFGTLDPETLRTVVDAIDQLAGDGRLVGIITHVAELAEHFPRIEVHKDRVGSKLEVVA
jgi:exonuclease SbcC